MGAAVVNFCGMLQQASTGMETGKPYRQESWWLTGLEVTFSLTSQPNFATFFSSSSSFDRWIQQAVLHSV
jgi:hypothetical protein